MINVSRLASPKKKGTKNRNENIFGANRFEIDSFVLTRKLNVSKWFSFVLLKLLSP